MSKLMGYDESYLLLNSCSHAGIVYKEILPGRLCTPGLKYSLTIHSSRHPDCVSNAQMCLRTYLKVTRPQFSIAPKYKSGKATKSYLGTGCGTPKDMDMFPKSAAETFSATRASVIFGRAHTVIVGGPLEIGMGLNSETTKATKYVAMFGVCSKVSVTRPFSLKQWQIIIKIICTFVASDERWLKGLLWFWRHLHGHVAEDFQVFLSHYGDIKGCPEPWLIQAWESSPCMSWFKLRCCHPSGNTKTVKKNHIV